MKKLIIITIIYSLFISQIVLANDTETKDISLSTNTNFQLFPPTLDPNLVLPPCQWSENEDVCTRTAKDEDIILEIYLGYKIAMLHKDKIESILKFDTKIIELSSESLELAETTIIEQYEYNDHLIKQYEKCYKEVDKERRKRVLRNILWGGGGMITGIGVGILIYVLATH